VLNGERNLNLLDFVDYVMDEDLRELCFCIYPFVCGWHPLGVVLTQLFTVDERRNWSQDHVQVCKCIMILLLR